MSAILYARVSTGNQAEKNLSIPAQLRACRQLAKVEGWPIAGEYQDTSSGRSFHDRAGLTAAIRQAARYTDVKVLIVHRLDRLARNLYDHMVIKGKLRQHGVNVVSVVENVEPSPIGELIEHIMAAQAEFYSANLSFEVKKGLEERLRRGQWNGPPPIGYLVRNGRIVLDQTRAPLLRLGFEKWATGTVNSRALAYEFYETGLVGRTGKKIRPSGWCRILHNRFYIGQMVVNGKATQGIHPPMITEELFNRCQDVFQAKQSGGRTRQKLHFLLARKVTCPRCGLFLVGEEHRKKNKTYRYYRCHEQSCRFMAQADPIENAIVEQLKAMALDTAGLLDGDAVQRRMVIETVVKRITLNPNPTVELIPEDQRTENEERGISKSHQGDHLASIGNRKPLG